MIEGRSTISPYVSSLCLSAVFAVTGCGWWIPKGDPPATDMAAPELQEAIAEVTNRLHKRPDDRWWEQFRSVELNQLMETALRDNPGLKVASARLREAQGLVRVEGARLLPFLDADASLTLTAGAVGGGLNWLGT